MWMRLLGENLGGRPVPGLAGTLKVEDALHLAKLVELRPRLVAGDIVGGVGHILLSVFDRLGELGRVELDKVDGCLRKHDEARRAHLGETAAYEIALMLTAGIADIEQPGS